MRPVEEAMDCGYVLRLSSDWNPGISPESEIVMIALEHMDKSSAVLQPVVDIPDLLLS